MPIYLCSATLPKVPSTSEFTQRGLVNMTIGRMSEIHTIGLCPPQLAFSGYKDAIEAFIFATAVGSKTLVSNQAYPLPDDYVPSIPLRLPGVIARLASIPSRSGLEKFLEKLDGAGAEEINVGKGTAAYTVSSPSWEQFLFLLDYCSPNTSGSTHYAQLDSVYNLLPIYKAIDLFCRVNTYYYKKNSENDAEVNPVEGILEQRITTHWFRSGFDTSTPHLQVVK